MLQTLFYIPCEVFGLPVFGFGLLLAVWAAASAVLLAWLIRRQGWNADTRSQALVLAVLGAAIALLLPLLCDARGLPIRGYGMMMLLAVLSGMGLAAYRARRVGVDPEMIFALAFWIIVPGMLGADRLRLRVLVPRLLARVLPRPWGLALCNNERRRRRAGGLRRVFGAMLGLGLFWWRRRVPLLATADLIAPSMLLGLALGRVGCLLNGCCYGGPCDLPWGVTFPWNSPVHQHEAEQGITGVFGLTFGNVRDDLPVVESVDANSPAAREGLTPGTKIDEINGVSVTSAEQATAVVLGIDKLNLILHGIGGEALFMSIDDPPESQTHGGEVVKIYGLEFAGSDDQDAVVSRVPWQSAEHSAGVRAGQRLISINGRRVDTIGRLRNLLDEHRQHPWLDIRPTAPASGYAAKPIRLVVDRPLPRTLPVHPTQLYSTIDALILCLLLLCYDRFHRRDGELTALMMTVYPVTRFLIEKIRTDEADICGTGMHISQNISVGLLVVAVCLWIYVFRRPAKLAFGA